MTASSEFGLGLYMIWTFALWVISVISLWKVFTKAGEPGWKAIIPVYNYYVLYKISWKGVMYLLTLLLAFVGAFLSSYYTPSNTAAVIAAAVILLVAVIIHIIQALKLSKVFGHGGGFALGLMFLPFIFYLILGFGSSEYKRAD